MSLLSSSSGSGSSHASYSHGGRPGPFPASSSPSPPPPGRPPAPSSSRSLANVAQLRSYFLTLVSELTAAVEWRAVGEFNDWLVRAWARTRVGTGAAAS